LLQFPLNPIAIHGAISVSGTSKGYQVIRKKSGESFFIVGSRGL
jgi:hypothetical protein